MLLLLLLKSDMSLGVLLRGVSLQGLPRCLLNPLGSLGADPGSALSLGGVRGKKSVGGVSTRNQGPNRPGRKRGMRCYDGQRVPIGTLLAKQFHLKILPGWNARWGEQNDIYATCNGRVLVTTEKCDLDVGRENSGKMNYYFPKERYSGRPVFRMHANVVPDQQHHYFKLVEQR